MQKKNKKEVKKGSAFLRLLVGFSGVSAVNAAIGLITSAVLANRMGVETYGVYVYWTSTILAIINIMPLGVGMAVVVYRYKLDFEDYARILRDAVFLFLPLMLMIVVGIGIVLSQLGIIILSVPHIILIVAISFLQSTILLAVVFSQASHKVMMFAAFSIPLYSGTYIISIGAYTLFSSIESMYMVIGIYLAAIYIGALLYLVKALSITVNEMSPALVGKRFMARAHMCIPAMMNAFLLSFLVIGDKLILAKLTSGEQLGIYGVASTLGAVPMFMVNNFASSWGAHLSRSLHGISLEKMRKKIVTSFKWMLLLPMLIVPVAGLQYGILIFMFSQEYLPAFKIVLILDVAFLFYGGAKLFMGYINYLERQAFNLFAVAVSGCVLVVLAPYMYQMFALYGMAIAVTISMALLLFCEIAYCMKIMGGARAH